MKVNDQDKENLVSIYKLILSSPELLISAAAQRGITIKKAYESVIEELRLLEQKGR